MKHGSTMQIPVPFDFDSNVRVRDRRIDVASAAELSTMSALSDRPSATRPS